MSDFDDEEQGKTPDGILEGTTIGGNYRIDKMIAEGGMGEVFRAHNIHNEEDIVAIKIVRDELARDETILSLAKKESSIISRLSHNAIVQYRMFVIDEVLKRPCLVMEYVDGEALGTIMERKPFSAQDVRSFLLRIADGLAEVHDADVIHRDLSPDNIILPGQNIEKAKIIDFGIARAVDLGKTLLGDKFAGKYNFVSPEQLGLYQGQISPRTDIYSLALVCIAAMQGKPLDMTGSGKPVDLIERRQTIPNLDHVDPSLRDLLRWMLQPDPADRPQDMRAVVDWLGKNAIPNDNEKDEVEAESETGEAGQKQHVISASDEGEELWTIPEPAAASSESFREAEQTSPPSQSADGDRTVLVSHQTSMEGGTELGGVSPSSHEWTASPNERLGQDAADELPAHLRAMQDSEQFATTTNAPPSVKVEKAPSKAKWLFPVSAGIAALVLVGFGAWALIAGLGGDDSLSSSGGGNKSLVTNIMTPDEIEKVASSFKDLKWVQNYEEGECFYAFVQPTSKNSASIIAFSDQEDAFKTFAQNYQAKMGKAPDLVRDLLVKKQCPITSFLKDISSSIPVYSIELESNRVRKGLPLRASFALRNKLDSYSVLLLDQSGIVYNITSYAEPFTKSGQQFVKVELNMELAKQFTQEQPQLILALSGDGNSVRRANITNPQRALKIFPDLSKNLEFSNDEISVHLARFVIAPAQ